MTYFRRLVYLRCPRQRVRVHYMIRWLRWIALAILGLAVYYAIN